MVKCKICNKKKVADKMKIKPILNLNESNQKRLYICSDECYKKYVEGWKNEI